MYKTRKNYWSLSPIAKWFLNYYGIPTPEALTFEEWEAHHKEHDHKLPSRIVDFLDTIQDISYFPYDVYKNVNSYIKNRFITKSHYLDTKLKKGQWYDFDTRMIHALFEGLVDFIEIEKSLLYVYMNPDEDDRKWYHAFIVYRNPKLGLKYLDWEINQTESKYQSESAKVQLELYNFWKNVRPNRIDPYVDCGNDYKKVDEIVRMFEREDDSMIMKLIKIRRNLWT